MRRRNIPEAAGYALGAELARFADSAAERLQVDGYAVPDRCSTCAFRAGTHPNGCVTTVMDATKCMLEHEPFRCHHDKFGQTPCAGWLAIMADAGPESRPVKAPWPYSDEAADLALAEQEKGR